MLVRRGGDAERLLHQAIRLIFVALGPAIVLVFIAPAIRLGRFGGAPAIAAETAPSLALHFAVREETSRDPTGTP